MNPHAEHQYGSDDVIEPATSSDARRIADEQFVHGLLRFLHRDTRARQRQRIDAVMRALREQEPVVGSVRVLRTSWRSVLAAAACLALVAVIALLGLPAEQSAQAMVQASIRASAEAGPRRYDVRAVRPFSESGELESIATLDVLDPQHVVFTAQSPRGPRIVVGRSANGQWAVRPNGQIERFHAGRPWPRWVEFSDRTLLMESVDAMLTRLSRGYTLQHGSADAGVGAAGSKSLDRITAIRDDAPRQFPDRIELLIDPLTRLVQRMELHWTSADTEIEAARRRHRMDLRNRDAETPDASMPRRPGERWRRMQRQPDPASSDAQPPESDDLHLRRAREMHARFLDGPPRFHDGRHQPPPRIIVFELVDAPDFPAGWFEPEAHAQQ